MNHAKHKAFPTRSKTRSGFTLVELVVVATILAILGAIGFGAYVSYIGTARDANRIAELSNIRAGLQGYMVHGDDLPLPSDYVTVYDGVDVLGYQGYAGQEVLNSIGLKKGGKDPSDGTYYTYYLTKSRNHFQLLGFLEEEENLPISAAIELIPSSYAVDYDERYPTVTGEKLGILVGTGSDLNKPIQEIESIISGGGNLDIAATGTEYTAIISDDYVVSGDNTVLSVVSALANSGGQIGESCKDLVHSNPGLIGKDGNYAITPEGDDIIEVYCDMTTDGGGWTFFGHMNQNGGGGNFFAGGTGVYQSDRADNDTTYSIGTDIFNDTEMMATLDKGSPSTADTVIVSDPITADAANKIVFFQYDASHTAFNTGSTPCSGLESGWSYRTQIGGGYTSGGTANYCHASYWYSRNAGNTLYLVLMHSGNTYGNYWGIGMGGDNSWYHDGRWYIR